MMRSGNPTLRGDIFTKATRIPGQGVMTIQGTVNKTLIMLFLTILSASWAWRGAEQTLPLIMPAAIIGLIVAIVTIFKKEWSNITAPIYALLEGVVLGGISLVFERSYPGIVSQAVILTFGTLFTLLAAYKSRLIKVTENFRLGIVAATGGIALVYIIHIIMGFFGGGIPFVQQGGFFGILFSLFVVTIAALNLVLDFDFIEKGESYGAPKYMEWYVAFSLMVTLIWLYLEMLRLLAKTRQR